MSSDAHAVAAACSTLPGAITNQQLWPRSSSAESSWESASADSQKSSLSREGSTLVDAPVAVDDSRRESDQQDLERPQHPGDGNQL